MDPVPPQVRAVMARLEEQDARDRDDGTPRERRLRAVRPEVGRFLLTLILATGAETVVELGTSGGYSTLWLAVGVSRTGGRVTTFEVDPAKVELASRSFADAGVGEMVDLRHQDAGAGLAALEPGTADLVFMDSEKEDYERFLALAVAALRSGGLLVADNLTSHREDLRGFRDAALAHPELSGLVVPIGRGELVAIKA
jgi:predicted O-methyltransferase YrrM